MLVGLLVTNAKFSFQICGNFSNYFAWYTHAYNRYTCLCTGPEYNLYMAIGVYGVYKRVHEANEQMAGRWSKCSSSRALLDGTAKEKSPAK